MKLINKFTLWYVCITLTCTLVSTMLNYFSVKNRINKASVNWLQGENDKVAKQLETGAVPDLVVHDHKITVDEITTALPAERTQVQRVCLKTPGSETQDCQLTVQSFYRIKNHNFRITSYDYVPRPEDILSGLEATILWRWLLIFGLIAVSARLVSRLILKPFNRTLKVIENFSLKKKKKIQLQHTGTKEFKELNDFLQKMTDKAIEDYASLKEFSENASHELQTPLAVIRGKLELLAESGLEDKQALLIAGIQNAVEKLSRINSSLTLLTKLENHEYEATEPICLSALIKEAINAYQELLEMKMIHASAEIQENVFVKLHPLLADRLLNNLLSNAIRHNIPDGHLAIVLTKDFLQIKNTGLAPEVPIDDLFKRFKKSNQSANSIGIGLSIVKQICELNEFTVNYEFEDGWHTLTVHFSNVTAEKPAGVKHSNHPELSPA